MAKLVDALPSGGSVRKDVQVRILFWAPNYKTKSLLPLGFKGFLFLSVPDVSIQMHNRTRHVSTSQTILLS